jgi:propanediol utilization protein
MADNKRLKDETGTQYAAGDEVTYSGEATALVQLVRLCGVTGSEGSKTVDAFPPLREQSRISVASGGLTTATTAYTAGDQVGTQFTMTNAARASGGHGVITGIVLVSAADIIGPYDVVIARESITLASDNAAYAISDADSLKLVQLVQLQGGFDIGNNRLAIAPNIYIPYDCNGGTSLYAGLITRADHTFFGATTDLQLIFYVERA